MVEITVLLYGKTFPLHAMQHIAAVIRETDGQRRTINVDFPRSDYSPANRLTPFAEDSGYGRVYEGNGYTNDNCCMGIVKLYSDENMSEFASQYYNKFTNKDYRFFSYNCSSAVDFALDYFFPENKYLNHCLSTYKAMCCCFFGLVFSCCPSPPGISMPVEIYHKAKWLERRYGSVEDLGKQSEENITKPLIMQK